MSLLKEDIIKRLEKLNLPFKLHEHKPVLTVDAHIIEVNNPDGLFIKNLFLKDKKHKYIIVSALVDTKIDIRSLSSRFGCGRSGMRMAPVESLKEILNVDLGTVNPFSICQESAKNVLLIMDQKIKELNKSFYVHPMINSASLEITHDVLEAFLESYERKAHYVDLLAEVAVVDKDNPADLKYLMDSLEIIITNNDENVVKNTSKEKKKENQNQDVIKIVIEEKPNDIITLVDNIMNKISNVIQKEDNDKVREIEKLKLDLEMDLNALKNENYAKGYQAALDEISKFCNKKQKSKLN